MGELKDQYDATFKLIERAASTWGDYLSLVSKMHTDLTFRAMVRVHHADNVRVEKRSVDRKSSKMEIPEGRIVYCADFNKDACPSGDHHQGIFNKKTVMKYHVCRPCLLSDGHPRNLHREGDPKCPLKV